MKKISTSALAKKLNLEWKHLFEILIENKYIEVKKKSFLSSEEIKVLTAKWIESWWELKVWTKYWDYIVWPEEFKPEELAADNNHQSFDNYLSISKIADSFNISARKMNQIISELGWIQQNIKWWKLTKFWEKIWWKEFVIKQSWATYTKWPDSIKNNASLLSALGIKNVNEVENAPEKKNKEDVNFREKFPAQYRTKDWHMVRSRGELVIDNSLYEYGLAHAYERKLPVEEDVYSDFYIPAKWWTKAVYIEYWGLEDQEKYLERKKIKKDIYAKYHLNLIELENKHIDNLDDFLPRMLLEFWIRVD